MKSDLCMGGLLALQEALKKAASLGYYDEQHGLKLSTGVLIARGLTRSHRIGHRRALKAAYIVGRFQRQMEIN